MPTPPTAPDDRRPEFRPFTADEIRHISDLQDKTKRGLYVMALVSGRLDALKPVVVGGFALEFYSTGGYRTSDVDALYLHPEVIGRMLVALGFTKHNRHWVSERHDLQIEFPGHAIEQRAVERLTTVRVDGLEVVLIGVEDLILDRLNGFVHFQSTDDRHWAAELCVMYRDHVDLGYLREQAVTDGTSTALQGILADLPST